MTHALPLAVFADREHARVITVGSRAHKVVEWDEEKAEGIHKALRITKVRPPPPFMVSRW